MFIVIKQITREKECYCYQCDEEYGSGYIETFSYIEKHVFKVFKNRKKAENCIKEELNSNKHDDNISFYIVEIQYSN